MPLLIKKESPRQEKDVVFARTLGAGDGLFQRLKKGQYLRVYDINGDQAMDFLFYAADNPADHYSAVKTIAAQKNIFLTTGTVCLAESGQPLLKITADICERHDTLGGACSPQSNTVRYAHEKEYMHACRDTFLLQISGAAGYAKRDLAPNVNIFTNVPLTPEGKLWFADGFSQVGRYIEFEALTDVQLLFSNCPQINNPCNNYNPTPLKVLIWDGENV
jgi:urea carboxylase-associated protein 1